MRPIRRAIREQINSLLAAADIEIVRLRRDFDERLESPKHLTRLFKAVGKLYSDWVDGQPYFNVKKTYDYSRTVEEFYFAYLESPFRHPHPGSRFGNLLVLHMVSRSLSPATIIDSGTYTGGSAWAFSLGSPDSKIYTFDISHKRLMKRFENVEYIERDWMDARPAYGNVTDSLCYFDDHIDQGKRLAEAASQGFKLSLFDDDFSVFNFYGMAYDGAALPKISFLLDDQIDDGEVIEWSDHGVRKSWRSKPGELSRLRALIDKAGRVPNLGSPLGIDQISYRIVTLK